MVISLLSPFIISKMTVIEFGDQQKPNSISDGLKSFPTLRIKRSDLGFHSHCISWMFYDQETHYSWSVKGVEFTATSTCAHF